MKTLNKIHPALWLFIAALMLTLTIAHPLYKISEGLEIGNQMRAEALLRLERPESNKPKQNYKFTKLADGG